MTDVNKPRGGRRANERRLSIDNSPLRKQTEKVIKARTLKKKDKQGSKVMEDESN
jgi:hypothetical protein